MDGTPMTEAKRKTLFSGIQPSGKLHWGTYFGAMKSMFDLQAKGENMFMFIANFHAMTTVRDGATLREATREVALDYLACGLDPAKTIVYRQSDVPEVQELAWYLSCLTPMGLLERCHSYKDKMAHGFDATHGLFAYPVLMAADILIMNADLVPVGKDQKQHLEVTRDLAIKFNNAFGEIFKIPDAYIPDTVATIPGTDGQKMSKSYHNTIELFDTSAKKKVMAASVRAGNYGYGHAKKALLEAYHRLFDPFKERREVLAKDPDALEDILQDGAKRARAAAAPTMEKVRKAVGL